MTRFAKRNVTGPQKKPLDATRWKDMKTNRKNKQKDKPQKEEKLHSILKTKKRDQSGNKLNKHKTMNYQKRVCFKCQQPGHKMSDCPKEGNTGDESELSELKERWKKEKRSDWRRQKRQKVKESKMVSYS